jgi:hypothetical protein
VSARRVWPVLAVDPGGAESGIVVRDRDDLLWHAVLLRKRRPLVPYLLDVVAATVDAADSTSPTIVAVEGVNEPNPHMGMTSVRGLIDTAAVLGALLGQWPHAIVVDPAGHGSGPLGAYPPRLVGAQEQRGAGLLRHARSAWDLAQAATVLARLTGGTR